jgi:hypothetical protein
MVYCHLKMITKLHIFSIKPGDRHVGLEWKQKNIIVICLESSGSHESVLHCTNPHNKTII